MQYKKYEAQASEIKKRKAELDQRRTAQIAKRNEVKWFIEAIRPQDRICQFNETLWYNTVECVRINPDRTLKSVFNGGQIAEG